MNPRILILEDDAALCRLYKLMLAKMSLEVDTVPSGEQAVELFVSAHNAGAPYQAVILDLNVQEGMGGLETLAKLKTIDPRVYTIVASGTSQTDIRAEYQNHGFSDALPKPFRLTDIEVCVNRMKSRLAQAGS